jgi:branched-chain amino acid transport system ATP-binding protein
LDSSVLKIDNLTVAYGAITALNGVSIEVERGRIVTLIGANGAGKTTTLRTISGLLRPQSGSITFKGGPIGGLPPHQIVARGLGHVPEGRMIFANLTVDENLAMGAYRLRDGMRIASNREYVFGMFPRLRERSSQLAGTLSGGEQQMLAIARALMGDPELLMLDEPSLGLAPRLIGVIFEKIVEINRVRGTTILLVEQNANLALEISHEAYVLESGRLVMQGDSQQLRRDPALKAAYLCGP